MEGHSQRYLDNHTGMICEDINIILQNGIEAELPFSAQLETLLTKHKSSYRHLPENVMFEAYVYVFKELRLLGYTHDELRA